MKVVSGSTNFNKVTEPRRGEILYCQNYGMKGKYRVNVSPGFTFINLTVPKYSFHKKYFDPMFY